MFQAIPVAFPKLGVDKAKAASASACIASESGYTVTYDSSNGCVIRITAVGPTTITLPSFVTSLTFSMVAGGGGGGSNRGGGGGAGGADRATLAQTPRPGQRLSQT